MKDSTGDYEDETDAETGAPPLRSARSMLHVLATSGSPAMTTGRARAPTSTDRCFKADSCNPRPKHFSHDMRSYPAARPYHTGPATNATDTISKLRPSVPLENANPKYLSANNPACWVAAPGVGRVYSWRRHHHFNMQLAQSKAQAARYQQVLQATYRELEVQRVNQDVFDEWSTAKGEALRQSREEYSLSLPWAGYLSRVSVRTSTR